MTRHGPRALPATVYLPAGAAMLDAQHVRVALGASRAVLSLWRRKYGLPVAHRDGRGTWTFTADLAAWLRRHNVELRMIE